MVAFLKYVLISACCTGFLYLGYVILVRKESNLQHLRYYLVVSMLLALVLPFSHAEIPFSLPADEIITMSVVSNHAYGLNERPVHGLSDRFAGIFEKAGTGGKRDILLYIYFLGLFALMLRMMVGLWMVIRLLLTAKKRSYNGTVVWVSGRIRSPFSFFRWVFMPEGLLEDQYIDPIIAHEKVHARQFHSADLILVELLCAFMWFNPAIWMMKKSLKLAHEYLADEGTLNTGVDTFTYQAVLINQVAEERLICFSPGFRYEFIKKRISMMNKRSSCKQARSGLFILLPLACFLFFGVAFLNGQDVPDDQVAVESSVEHVLYIGVENVLKIAPYGYNIADLSVTIDNGKITGENGSYIARVIQPRFTVVTISSQGKVIQMIGFQVKPIPDPVAVLAGKKEGEISKGELLAQTGLLAEVENFPYDVRFRVVEFTLVTVNNERHVVEETALGNVFSAEQRAAISTFESGRRFYFEGIMCVGPDGKVRKIEPMRFVLSD